MLRFVDGTKDKSGQFAISEGAYQVWMPPSRLIRREAETQHQLAAAGYQRPGPALMPAAGLFCNMFSPWQQAMMYSKLS